MPSGGSTATRNRRAAGVFSWALIVLAVLASVFAALLEFGLGPAQSLDPNGSAFGTAAGFAAAFCIAALWKLRRFGRGRAGSFGTAAWFNLAVLALLGLIVVAFASRLGG